MDYSFSSGENLYNSSLVVMVVFKSDSYSDLAPVDHFNIYF